MNEQKKKNTIESIENPTGMMTHHSHVVLQDIGNSPHVASLPTPLPPPLSVDENNDNPSSYIDNSFDSNNQLYQNVHIQESDRVETLSLLSMNVGTPSPRTAIELQLSPTTVPTKKRQFESNNDTNVTKRKYLGNNEIIPHVSPMNHEYITSYDLDGCNITSISKSPFPNPRKIEFRDFLHNDKLSADFLIYQLDDDTINETNMKTITTSKYKLFFIAEQEKDRRQDSALAWSGAIYPDKNNIENDSILDSNATFLPNAKQMVFTIEALNRFSTVGLKSPQVFLVRTDLLDACKKENEKDIYKICDEKGFGLMRVIDFDNGTVLLKRQSILYSKLDTTEWCWLQSTWFKNGKKNGICLATMVAASIHGLAPANPIKDPCVAIYRTNEEQKKCCIEISITGTLRSGKCYQVDDGKTRIETNVERLVEYYDKHGHFNIKRTEDKGLYSMISKLRKKWNDGKMSQEDKKKLDDIGFDCTITGMDKNVERLVEYYDKHKHYNIKQTEDKGLYLMSCNLRKKWKEGKMSEEDKKKLDDIGFDFEISNVDDAIERLVEYYDKNGHYNFKKKEDKGLYGTALHLKKKWKDGKISQEDKRKLDDIGFTFEIRDIPPNTERLVEYYDKNGHYNIKQTEDKPLYKAAYYLRKKWKEGKMSEQEKKKLDDIGFDWEGTDFDKKIDIDKKVERLVEYYDKHGHYNINRNEKNGLYGIAYKLRKKWKDGKMSEEDKKKLDKIGFK